MLISLCVSVMNRLDDLRQVMPAWIAETDASPPVEICVVDYNSTDGLWDYLSGLNVPGDCTFQHYTGRNHWHMAHAKNIAALLGDGEYVVTMNADDEPQLGFVKAIRWLIVHGYRWGYVERLCSTIYYRKDDFIAAGGYDERFELYGPEDRDMQRRMRELYGEEGIISHRLLKNIYTPDDKKVANYRVKGSKHQHHRSMLKFYVENIANNVLIANQGKEWGSWTA